MVSMLRVSARIVVWLAHGRASFAYQASTTPVWVGGGPRGAGATK